MDFNTKQIIINALDKAIVASRGWSDTAHKVFVDLVDQNREKILSGDFSFFRDFRREFAISEMPSLNYGVGGPTLETRFYQELYNIGSCFAKVSAEIEKKRLIESYTDMLQKGNRDGFFDLLNKERERLNVIRRANPQGFYSSPEIESMEEALRKFSEEEAKQKAQPRITNRVDVPVTRVSAQPALTQTAPNPQVVQWTQGNRIIMRPEHREVMPGERMASVRIFKSR
jgi:hypothetical protein